MDKPRRRKKKRTRSREDRWILLGSGVILTSLIVLLMSRVKRRPDVNLNLLIISGGLIWVAAMFVLWAILRDRRKHRNTRDSHPTIGTDYREQLEEEKG